MDRDAIWREHQRRRMLRPDFARWLKPDWRDRKYWVTPPPAWAEHPDDAAFPPPQARTAPAAFDAVFWRERFEIKRLIAELQRELRPYLPKYNPDQPRVPAGNPDGGQWTSGGGGGDWTSDEREADAALAERIRLAGPPPTNEPPQLPKKPPPTAQERNAAVKAAARWLARLGGPIGRIGELAFWLYDYEDYIQANLDGPKSLEELQQAVSTPKRRYQTHHIVEQKHATMDGFPHDMIHGRDNLVLIPTLKHREITAWYQTKNSEFGDVSVRDYLRGKSWNERRQIGIKALIDVGVLRP